MTRFWNNLHQVRNLTSLGADESELPKSAMLTQLIKLRLLLCFYLHIYNVHRFNLYTLRLRKRFTCDSIVSQQAFLVIILKLSGEQITVAKVTWLILTEDLCDTWPSMCFVLSFLTCHQILNMSYTTVTTS